MEQLQSVPAGVRARACVKEHGRECASVYMCVSATTCDHER